MCVSVCVCYCGDERGGGERRLSFCGLHCPPPQKSELIFTIQWFIKRAARIVLLQSDDLKRFLPVSNQFRFSVNGNVDLQT